MATYREVRRHCKEQGLRKEKRDSNLIAVRERKGVVSQKWYSPYHLPGKGTLFPSI